MAAANRRQEFEEALGMLEQADRDYKSQFGAPIFQEGDLERLGEYIATLDQDSDESEYDAIESALVQGLSEVLDRLDLDQADPDGPKLADKPRTPEADGSTANGIKEPYPHPGLDEWLPTFLAKVASVKKSGNKVVIDDGRETYELIRTEKGPQQIESGDNPDSYARQNADPNTVRITDVRDEVIGMLDQAVGPAFEQMTSLNAEMERRLVQDDVRAFIGNLPDPATQQAARSLLQNVATRSEFEEKTQDIGKFVGTLTGGKWQHAAKGVGFNTGNPSDAPVSPDGRLPETIWEIPDYLTQAALDQCDLGKVLNQDRTAGAPIARDVSKDPDFIYDNKDGVPYLQTATPQAGLRMLLRNMVQQNQGDATHYLNLLQAGDRGFRRLDQAMPGGSTAASGVVAGQPFIFPLISRVYPQLLLARVGAVYPIDRPDTRFFYWNDLGYKYDGAGSVSSTAATLYQMGCYDLNIASDPGEGVQASRLGFELVEELLSVSPRKMTAFWSQEMEDKLIAYHNRDPLGEYITRMADHIAREVNFNALELMLDASDAQTVTYGTDTPSGWEPGDWKAQLHGYVQRASSKIFQSRYREASFVIGDADSTDRLMRTMASGAFQQTRDTWEFAHGIQVVGSPQNFYTVIKCAWWGRDYPGSAVGKFKDKLLLVARGDTFSDCGIVYAPFTYRIVPLFAEPNDFTKRVGVMEQSALKVVIPQMFARVDIRTGVTGVDW